MVRRDKRLTVRPSQWGLGLGAVIALIAAIVVVLAAVVAVLFLGLTYVAKFFDDIGKLPF